MLTEDAEKHREDERKALEAYLPDKIAFSIPETAKILGRSTRWARRKTQGGQLRSVYVGGTRRVTRPTIIAALMEGVEK